MPTPRPRGFEIKSRLINMAHGELAAEHAGSACTEPARPLVAIADPRSSMPDLAWREGCRPYQSSPIANRPHVKAFPATAAATPHLGVPTEATIIKAAMPGIG